MNKIIAVGIVLAATLAMVGFEKVGNVPDILSAIATRKSVRKFDPLRTVEDEKVEKILKAAMCAPSAMDKRPWEFVVVKDKTQLKKLGERLPYSRVGNGAQLAIVVCGSLDNGLPGRGKEYWIHDCSAASMNILLAAHGLGLGAVWTGVYPGEDRIAAVREILAIPDGYAPLGDKRTMKCQKAHAGARQDAEDLYRKLAKSLDRYRSDNFLALKRSVVCAGTRKMITDKMTDDARR